MSDRYYDGTKLLSMLDINGRKPEIYMRIANRKAGEITYFRRRETNLFMKKKAKGQLYGK